MSDQSKEGAKDNRVAVGCTALVEAYDAYVKLLGDELNDVVQFAAAHGWKSSRYEDGCRLRKKIEELKASTVGTQRPGTPDGPLATEKRKPGSLE